MGYATPVYIVLRQSPEWATQTYADLEKTRDFCRLIGRPENFMIERVLLWDRTFRTGFFAVRQVLKEISLENFRSVSGAILVSLEQTRNALDPDAFYLFTDDDDWYHPGIARVLSGLDPRACEAILWHSALFRRGLAPRQPDAFYTNNYAVSGAMLAQKRGNLERVYQHFEAHKTFFGKTPISIARRIGYASLVRRFMVKGFCPIIRLSEYLSMTNKHPASTLVLERLGENPTPEQLRTLVENSFQANRSAAVSPEFHWALSSMERVNDFFACLLDEAR
jgi:hypothetical protein